MCRSCTHGDPGASAAAGTRVPPPRRQIACVAFRAPFTTGERAGTCQTHHAGMPSPRRQREPMGVGRSSPTEPPERPILLAGRVEPQIITFPRRQVNPCALHTRRSVTAAHGASQSWSRARCGVSAAGDPEGWYSRATVRRLHATPCRSLLSPTVHRRATARCRSVRHKYLLFNTLHDSWQAWVPVGQQCTALWYVPCTTHR